MSQLEFVGLEVFGKFPAAPVFGLLCIFMDTGLLMVGNCSIYPTSVTVFTFTLPCIPQRIRFRLEQSHLKPLHWRAHMVNSKLLSRGQGRLLDPGFDLKGPGVSEKLHQRHRGSAG
jgi:hypothetical protein